MKIISRESIIQAARAAQAAGKTVGFTSGTFDILHVGHVDYLRQARASCGLLIVAVNTDASVRLYKGPDRPIVSENDRAAVVAALEAVDHVFLFDEVNNNLNIDLIRPNLYIKASQYAEEKLSSKPIVERYGGKVLLIPMTLGSSSTNLIDRIKRL